MKKTSEYSNKIGKREVSKLTIVLVYILSLILLMSTTAFAGNRVYVGTTIQADDEILRTVVSINKLREELGLSSYTINEKLKEMALTHSRYMNYNNSLTSIEESDLLYFRGKYPWDRADAIGYDKDFVYEVVKKDYANYMEIYNELINDPLTRNIVLNPMYTDIGMNVHKNYFTLEFGGNDTSLSKGVFYPSDKQINVEPVWEGKLLDTVNSNPNTNVTYSGIPITYTYYGDEIVSYKEIDISIIDQRTEESIFFKVIEPGVQRQLKNTLTLIPLSTYMFGRTYEVHMQFSFTLKSGLVKKIDETFEFTTRPNRLSTIEDSKFVTREVFIDRVIENEYLDLPLIESLESKFNDVDINSFSSVYINTASEMGIINGYPDGRFGPDLNISKNQAYTILIKAYETQFPPLDMGLTFSLEQYDDSENIASWARKYMRKAGFLGILMDDDNYLYPEKYLTVEEFEEIMNEFDKKLKAIRD